MSGQGVDAAVERDASLRILVPAALGATSIDVFHRAILQVRQAPVRVIVLEGSEGVFCRGMDMAELGGSAWTAAEVVQSFARLLTDLRLAGRPTIAVVDGEALGGGLGVAAACDLVVATPRSRFGLPEVLFGLLPGVVLPVLLDRMPAQKARLLALQAGTISAAEAQAIGLVDAVVAQEDLERALRRWVRTFSRAEPVAVGTLKRYAAEVASLDVAAGIERGAGLTAERLADRDVLDSVRDFVAGGSPRWLER